MITAIVLIDADVRRIPQVGQRVAEIPGVDEVYSVTGGVDLVAMVRVREYEELATVISEQLNGVDGIVKTRTHLAFRAYSTRDLEAGFDLGLDG